MLFYLLSVHGFLRTGWISPGAKKYGLAYALSLLAFLLAMLSKGSVAPLPLVLLGIMAWRRRPTGEDLAGLAPFFAVAAGLVGVNIWFQTHGADEIIRHASGIERLLGAAASVWFYLSKAVVPVDLTFVYPQWRVDAGQARWWVPLLAALALTVALWRGRRRIPAAFFAWAYFVVMLLPVLGFTDVYFMRYSLVADHYEHLAMIGVLALTGAGWDRWRLRPGGGTWAWAAATPRRQRPRGSHLAPGWRLSRRGHSLPGDPRAEPRQLDGVQQSRPARIRRRPEGGGGAGLRAGDPAESEFAEAYLNRGELQLEAGRFQEAIGNFAEALRLRPNYPEACYNLGNAWHALGRNPEAVADFARALRLRPQYPEAENNLGSTLVDLGRVPEAISHYERAIQIDPAYDDVRFNLANALAGQGHDSEAIAEYTNALHLKPDYPEAENNLAMAEERSRQLEAAIAHFEAAVRLRPGYVQARNNLGVALAMARRPDEARAEFEEVLRQQPDYAPARQNLARLRAMGP